MATRPSWYPQSFQSKEEWAEIAKKNALSYPPLDQKEIEKILELIKQQTIITKPGEYSDEWRDTEDLLKDALVEIDRILFMVTNEELRNSIVLIKALLKQALGDVT